MNYMKENSVVSKQISPLWKPKVYELKDEPLPAENSRKKVESSSFGPREYGIFGITFLLLLASVAAVFMLREQFEVLRYQRLDTIGGTILIGFGLLLALVAISFLIFLVVLHRKYRPIASVSDAELPTCTIIVPAYNEGRLVYDTLHSLAGSDYPVQKLQIIAIDDGSKDNTFDWIQRAKLELGDRIEIYKQPKNMGKRHALYRGFKLGTGEIFITVDSDSVVNKDTIRNMASPFVTNKECGAVAGNVRVLNNKKAIIPRMLNVSFVFSFEFVRSAQSELGTVMCTPGALSGYRRVAVMNCLEDWINQTFMGQPSDIGEDRAMTNMILKQGYHVLFQSNAYVYTDTPIAYKNLYKMFIRWERSNVRENIMMGKFAFTNFRKGPKWGARLLLIMQWKKVLLAYPMLLLTIWTVFHYPLLFLSSTLVGILLFSSIQAYFFATKNKDSKEALWAYSYSLFYVFSLFWITPFAIATAGRRGWLTRG